MAIHMLNQQATKFLPRIGTIRLGIRKESASGVEYPETVPHFVLDDAPEIAKVYGNTPTEIEAFFLADDIDEAVPAFWKWYSGGKRDKQGNIVGGELLCWGEGPSGYDPDGTAIPGKAWHKAARDPKTGVIPNRGCLGEQCKDYCNERGKPQCSPVMTLNLFVPRASLMGIFTIETKSKVTMSRFLSQLTLIKEQFGSIKGIPFKIYRDPVSLQNPEKPGQKRTQYIVSIKPFLEFKNVHGDDISKQIADLTGGNFLVAGKTESLTYTPSPDVEPVVSTTQLSRPLDKLEVCKQVAEDPEVVQLFEALFSAKGGKNTPQNRLLVARRHESADDVRTSLVTFLRSELAKGTTATPKATPTTPTVEVDANGLI